MAALLAAVESTPASFGLWTRDGGALLSVKTDLRCADAHAHGRVGNPALAGCIGAVEYALGDDRHSNRKLSAEGRLTYSVRRSGVPSPTVESPARRTPCSSCGPTPIEDVLAVAAAGEFMPAKSTFFYPKAATGLVFNPLAD